MVLASLFNVFVQSELFISICLLRIILAILFRRRSSFHHPGHIREPFDLDNLFVDHSSSQVDINSTLSCFYIYLNLHIGLEIDT